eukprot:m51a1_g4509 hypothetical protein (529) ;mRNA; r:395540-398192
MSSATPTPHNAAQQVLKAEVTDSPQRGRRSLQKSLTLAATSPLGDKSFMELASEISYQTNFPKSFGDRCIQTIEPPESRGLSPEMLFSMEGKPNLQLLRSHLCREGRLSLECALRLVRMARSVLCQEPNVLRVSAPVLIIGDIHGQVFDLFALLDRSREAYGPSINYLFLGDYVDRGDFSTEVLFYLLAMKVANPYNVWLLRGNHETRMMSEFMTFQLECDFKYGSDELYGECTTLFDSFPLCAAIVGSQLGTFLAVHGGISPELASLDDIEQLDRFTEPPPSGPLCDLLWSDPLDPPERISRHEAEAWMAVQFVPNTLRQTSFHYGLGAVRNFLDANDLACIIRGHQVVDDGYKEHRYLTSRKTPYVVTVFSAPNYCDMYGNKGAALMLGNTMEYLQMDNVAHPYYLPDFADVFSWSIPYLMESLVTMLSDLVIAIKEENMADITPEKRARDISLAGKMQQMRMHLAELEEQQAKREKSKRELLAADHPNVSKFLRAVTADAHNERFPSTPKPARELLKRKGSLLFW